MNRPSMSMFASADDYNKAMDEWLAAETRASMDATRLINELEYAVLARAQSLPGSAEKLSKAKQAIRIALGVTEPAKP